MNLIWATRGRTWGFRFLKDGGEPDPLVVYDRVFSGVEDEREVCRRDGEMVALRFPDPEGRKDVSGRLIPHEFVVYPPLAAQLNSVEDGIRLVWDRVADEYERIWKEPAPPSASG